MAVYDYSYGNTEGTLDYKIQKRRTEIKGQNYIMEQVYKLESTANSLQKEQTESDTATSLFEFDIVGARIAYIGQRSGGFIREVEENEAALSFVVQDKVALYLLNEVNRNEGSISADNITEMIANGSGMIRVIKLLQCGLLDSVGNYFKITERGLYILRSIQEHASG